MSSSEHCACTWIGFPSFCSLGRSAQQQVQVRNAAPMSDSLMRTIIMVMPQDVQLITAGLFASVLEKARQSPRRRANFNFHPSLEDNPHRFLNVMLEGTYIQPHRHLEPPKAETFLVLEGRAVIFLFDENGNVKARYTLGPEGEALGIDIAPGIWH